MANSSYPIWKKYTQDGEHAVPHHRSADRVFFFFFIYMDSPCACKTHRCCTLNFDTSKNIKMGRFTSRQQAGERPAENQVMKMKPRQINAWCYKLRGKVLSVFKQVGSVKNYWSSSTTVCVAAPPRGVNTHYNLTELREGFFFFF